MPSQKRGQHSLEVPRVASLSTPAHPETQIAEVWEREEDFNTYFAKRVERSRDVLGVYY